MAFEYQGFASLGVNLNRQKYGPLDISNVFTSEADLKYYLSKGEFTEGVSEYWYKDDVNKVAPYPYEGQVLATVIDGVVTVCVLALDAGGNFVAQEIGSTVDDASIESVDGKLTLKGFNVAAEATIPQKQADGSITWVKISDVVSGDTNTTYDLVAADGSGITVNKVKAESGDHYTYTIDVSIPSAAYSIKKTEGEGSTTYQLTKDGVVEGSEIIVPDAYDDTALAERVTTVESKLSALEGTTHFIGVKEALPDVANVGDVCIVGNKEYINTDEGWVELGDTSAEAERLTALEKIDHEAYKAADATLKEELEGKISAKQDAIPENTYDAYGAAEKALEDATAYVDETKITDVTVAHTGDGTAEGATITDGVVHIVIDSYTKAETLDKIAEKITEINGGESAGEVLGALNSYKETNDERVLAVETSARTNADAIATLIGSDEGSVDKKISDAISAIPTATIERLGLVKASETISVDADGTLNVAKVSTDLLVQGENELVLRGGSAH